MNEQCGVLFQGSGEPEEPNAFPSAKNKWNLQKSRGILLLPSAFPERFPPQKKREGQVLETLTEQVPGLGS